ncbi:MAG: hypothetical protein IPJ56_17875 [Gemmatimonadetes bacterium]|nr:hypothetical protein [Gemmatimonadota bacterium]
MLVHSRGFQGDAGAHGDFHFMSSRVSGEKPVDYREIARMLVEEKRRGGRVVGDGAGAGAFAGARQHGLVRRNGYVQALLAGNVVAVHDSRLLPTSSAPR